MCGIFAYIGPKQDAAQLTLAALKTLEYRGYDSWGIAIKEMKNEKLKMNNVDAVLVEKHIGKIGEAQTSLPSSSLAIGHTRWATHGGVTDANAHPHLSSDSTIAVVHNGIIENYRDLRESLTHEPITYSSQTDTEVVAHLIESRVRSGVPYHMAVMQTFCTLHGSNAIVALSSRDEEVVACRDGSPLVIGIAEGEYILASDVTALLPYTQDVYFVRDGETVRMTRDGVSIYDTVSGRSLPLTTERIEWTAETAQKGGYPHYMLKEIMEQITSIPRATQLNTESITTAAERIRAADHVIITGCGTAYHCALLAKYLLARAGVRADVIAANELPPYIHLLTDRTVLIAISQSGETADTLIAVKAAKARGAHIIAAVNARSSSLERIAHTTLSVGAGPEISVVSTKAFTAQATTMYMLAHSLHSSPDSQLSTLGMQLTEWLTPEYLESVRSVATSLLDATDIYVIGRFENYPIAMESALKIKEASYIHAEGFASGELKHGVISLIQRGTPCIVIASEDEAKREILSSATELATRGGHIIGISPTTASEYAVHLKSLDLGDATPLANAIVGQLLGYYLSVGRGADPDRPRNLAKSVTVK